MDLQVKLVPTINKWIPLLTNLGVNNLFHSLAKYKFHKIILSKI
jgi:hypothetical protein